MALFGPEHLPEIREALTALYSGVRPLRGEIDGGDPVTGSPLASERVSPGMRNRPDDPNAARADQRAGFSIAAAGCRLPSTRIPEETESPPEQ